jgi:hypothetical protein
MMFFVGVSDAIWHKLFGIEKNIDGLLSPTHIAGMLFAGIFLLGPFRELYRRTQPLNKLDQFVLTYTIVLFYALMIVLTQETTVFWRLWPLNTPRTNNDGQYLAVVSFIFQGLLLSGIALVTLRHFRLPFGFFTSTLLTAGIGMSFMQWHVLLDIGVSLSAGLLLDASYYWLRPSVERSLQLRIFSVITAICLPMLYLLLTQLLAGPVIWSIHLIMGSVAVTGIFGWLLSYVAVPPALPQVQQEQ